MMGVLGAETAQENNDFFDNEPFVELTLGPLEVVGEVARPGRVAVESLPLRTVIVREARTGLDGHPGFIGAYVYQGYSLFDILRERAVEKRNKAEFGSVIDLLVAVENTQGEAAVFSWGEVFYPQALHRILIARRAAPIVPSKTGERWPRPGRARVVAAGDLVSDRNIEAPAKIRVMSAPASYGAKKAKGAAPLRSPTFQVITDGLLAETVSALPVGAAPRVMPSVFFGRGRGFHGLTRFEGVPLRELLGKALPAGAEGLRRGAVVIAGADGYRAAFTVSEIANRNDNGEFLLCDRGEGEGGRFSVYPGPDFFSDRAVKALFEVKILRIGVF